MKTVTLSKVQLAFLDFWVPAQLHWLKQCGFTLGSVPEPAQRRTLKALVRKEVVTPDGQITQSGLMAWRRATKQPQDKEDEV